jgi:hypothetical protein
VKVVSSLRLGSKIQAVFLSVFQLVELSAADVKVAARGTRATSVLASSFSRTWRHMSTREVRACTRSTKTYTFVCTVLIPCTVCLTMFSALSLSDPKTGGWRETRDAELAI